MRIFRFSVLIGSDGSMLLVTHLLCGQLRVYRIQVDFQRSQLHVSHLQIIDDCIPVLPDDTMSLDVASQLRSFGPLSTTFDRMYLLIILPSSPATPNAPPNPPCVLAVFSRDLNTSIVSRWEFRNVSMDLHQVFTSLTSKLNGSPASLKVRTFLLRISNFIAQI